MRQFFTTPTLGITKTVIIESLQGSFLGRLAAKVGQSLRTPGLPMREEESSCAGSKGRYSSKDSLQTLLNHFALLSEYSTIISQI